MPGWMWACASEYVCKLLFIGGGRSPRLPPGGSCRGATEGECVSKNILLSHGKSVCYRHAGSPTRLRREPPPGGGLIENFRRQTPIYIILIQPEAPRVNTPPGSPAALPRPRRRGGGRRRKPCGEAPRERARRTFQRWVLPRSAPGPRSQCHRSQRSPPGGK